MSQDPLDEITPFYHPWVLPLLRALEALGGAARPKKAIDTLVEMHRGQLSDKQWGRVLTTRCGDGSPSCGSIPIRI